MNAFVICGAVTSIDIESPLPKASSTYIDDVVESITTSLVVGWAGYAVSPIIATPAGSDTVSVITPFAKLVAIAGASVSSTNSISWLLFPAWSNAYTLVALLATTSLCCVVWAAYDFIMLVPAASDVIFHKPESAS